MGRKKVAGLINRKGIRHIDKVIRGRRLCESTGESEIERAEEYLARRIEEIRQAEIFGVRPKRTWRQAVIKYLNEGTQGNPAREDARHLSLLDPFIGWSCLGSRSHGEPYPFHRGSTTRRVAARETINYALQTVRHILNLASGEWMDEYGLTWLAHAPKIKLLREDDRK